MAERAGVSVGSLYQYFPNKDALIAALHARHVERMMIVIERALANAMHGSLAQALSELIEGAVEAHRVETGLHQVLELQLAGLDLVSARDSFDTVLRERVVAVLERHRDELSVPDLKLAAFMLMHSAHALIHAVVLQRPKGVSLPAATREIVRMVHSYLTGAPAPA